MKYFKKVERGNIYLSPLNSEDYEIQTKWMNDHNVTDFLSIWHQIISLEWSKQLLDNNNKNGNFAFAIIKKSEDTYIGDIVLHSIDHIHQTGMIRIKIWEIQEHGKGYGQDAINALLSYAFHMLNLYNITLWVRSFNIKAISCYTKCWFKKIGEKHHCIYYNGAWYDNILMEMLKPDWEEKYRWKGKWNPHIKEN